MIHKLAGILPGFPGPVNRVRCFAHIVNLVAKIILHQFDVSKGWAKRVEDDLDESNFELSELSEDLDDEMDDGDISNDEVDEEDIDNLNDADMEAELAEVEEVMREDMVDLGLGAEQFSNVLHKVCAINFHRA
jgi:hypothetical protein